ncbi:MAG: universal stress protein [Desulfobacterales bacterium]|nr:universal stress protein [Desulfobacterales bacterium]
MLKKILVCTDGSEDARKAVLYASAFSKALNIPMTILNVILTGETLAGMIFPFTEEIKPADEIAKREGERILQESRSVAESEGVTCNTKFIAGTQVSKAVAAYAEKEGYDLIVVGSRGMGAFKRAAIGSSSVNLVNFAHCPVIVVR